MLLVFWCNSQKHDIIKKRLDSHGNVIETRQDGIGAPKVNNTIAFVSTNIIFIIHILILDGWLLLLSDLSPFHFNLFVSRSKRLVKLSEPDWLNPFTGNFLFRKWTCTTDHLSPVTFKMHFFSAFPFLRLHL